MKTKILLSFLLILSLQANAQKNERSLPFEPEKTAIIVIDMWNSHWCMTASERVSAMVPRMNRVLDISRKLGVQIIWNPSDVVTAYAGYPQYEKAVAVEHHHAPDVRKDLSVKFTAQSGGCLCGPGLQCRMNYGWDAMHPDLFIGDDDLFSASTDEIYSLLKERRITTIIYMGVHTNMCVFGKPGAMSKMWKAGFNCILARDLNDAFTTYNPDNGYTPEQGTAEIDDNLQNAGIPVLNLGEIFKQNGLWKEKTPVDYVRFTPWGKNDRPYFFTRKTVVTLTAPWIDNAEIRYTEDGSEPTAKSTIYKKPFEIRRTTEIRAAAFVKGKQASLPSSAYYVKISAQTPPLPDIYLDELEYTVNGYLKQVPSCMWYPEKNLSYEGQPLIIRGKTYEHGLGFRAPSAVQYEIKPEYKRFVALAGIDENILDTDNARFVANNISVVFKVFIDGKLSAESPVMLLSQEPWRFDIKIPQGSRQLNIVCMDAGSRNLLDYGNWVNAGFITK
jgi:nicotinamidase-related amidase